MQSTFSEQELSQLLANASFVSELSDYLNVTATELTNQLANVSLTELAQMLSNTPVTEMQPLPPTSTAAGLSLLLEGRSPTDLIVYSPLVTNDGASLYLAVLALCLGIVANAVVVVAIICDEKMRNSPLYVLIGNLVSKGPNCPDFLHQRRVAFFRLSLVSVYRWGLRRVASRF